MRLLKHLTVLKKKEIGKLTESVFEERPTKLKIPNSNPMGGDMDGMDDLDNAPMPPMGADDMGMDDQMDGGPDAMGDDMGMDDPMASGGPDDMGAPDDEGPDDMGAPDDMGGEDDELMSIINNLSIEDKAAVTKYAKSMVDDSEDSMPQDDDMPMESRRRMKRIIDEVFNDVVLDKQKGTKRPEKKLPKEYREMESPFKSPF